MANKPTGDRPEMIDQKGPSPGQSRLTPTDAQSGVPYKSGAATPNPGMSVRGPISKRGG